MIWFRELKKSDRGGSLHLGNNCIEVSQRLFRGKRVHLAAQAFASFERGPQIMAGDFHRERIGDRLSGALFIFHPSGMWQRDPDGLAIDEKLDIHGIGVPRRDGNDQRLIDAVDLLFGPAVGGGEVGKHG
jgi:hypothetical protein